MNLQQLDFDQAKARHILFKIKLRSFLYGAEVDEASVISHTACLVGQWIYNFALDAYGHVPEMKQLEQVHKKLHEQARQLIASYRSGDVLQARDGFQAVEITASKLTALLDVVESKVKEGINAVTPQRITEQLTIDSKDLLDLHTALFDLYDRIKNEALSSTRVRRAVEESESRFRNTMMQAPVGIVILHGYDMIVETANETYLQIVDRGAEDFVGHPLFKSLPEVEDAIRPILNEVMNTGVPFYGYEFEVPLKRFGKKSQAYFNFVYQPYREIDGTVTGIIAVANDVTLLVNAKRKLEQSEKQFRNLVSQSPVGMGIFMGMDFVIDLANDTLLNTLWHRSFDEVHGKKLLEVFPELKEQVFPKLLMDVYTSGVPHKENEAVAYIDTHLGMRKHYLDFEYAPFYNTEDTVQGIVLTVYDVTEKVESRISINEAEQRARLAIEAADMGTFDWNLAANQFFSSQRLVEIFGFENKDNVSHTDLISRFHPDDVAVRNQAVKDSFTKGSLTYDARVIWPDQSIHWVKVHGKIVHDQSQKPQRMYGTVIDATEQNNATLELIANEAKFRLLADSMPQLIWTGDPQGNLNYFSEAVYQYSGLTPEQMNMYGWLQIVHPDERDENVRHWTEAVRTGEPFLFEHRFRRYDGEYRWQLSRAIPQRNASGKIHMWVGTSTDIHDRKVFINELETTVQKRTQELTESNQALVKSNAELAQFAYVASHDLQEPLRKIQTFASRILESENDKLSDRGKNYFSRVQGAANRMQQLITDLLSFSHISTVQKQFVPTDVNMIVQGIQDQLSDRIEQSHAVIRVAKLPVLSVIPFQFEQLLTNLIGNALKYARPGVPPVIDINSTIVAGSEVSYAGVNPTGHYHLITVTDNGIGFDPEFSERIFQVFQRLHGRDAYEGTGIGLAICKKIIDNHQGLIAATAVPDQGATFYVYVPVNITSEL